MSSFKYATDTKEKQGLMPAELEKFFIVLLLDLILFCMLTIYEMILSTGWYQSTLPYSIAYVVFLKIHTKGANFFSILI